MSNGNNHEGFDLEQKLNELNLTPAQRDHAVSALRVATDAVDVIEAITGAFKRVAGAMSLKPSVRA